jgi:hypothetical protein
MDNIGSKNEKEEIQDPRSSVRVTFCVHNWSKYPFQLGSLKSFDDHEVFTSNMTPGLQAAVPRSYFPNQPSHGRQT